MHCMFLLEDSSGGKMVEAFAPKLLNENDTYEIHTYKGIGRIPKNITSSVKSSQKTLLANLPKAISGIGRTWSAYPNPDNYHLFVIFDSDSSDITSIEEELNKMMNGVTHKPQVKFCIAVEEGEAWLLGDIAAVKSAYPNAKSQPLASYVNDSICGTWEVLANSVYPGGAAALSKKAYYEIGRSKTEWAEKISPLVDIANNKSPSFQKFRSAVNSINCD